MCLMLSLDSQRLRHETRQMTAAEAREEEVSETDTV